jgi:hypothetical protein
VITKRKACKEEAVEMVVSLQPEDRDLALHTWYNAPVSRHGRTMRFSNCSPNWLRVLHIVLTHGSRSWRNLLWKRASAVANEAIAPGAYAHNTRQPCPGLSNKLQRCATLFSYRTFLVYRG